MTKTCALAASGAVAFACVGCVMGDVTLDYSGMAALEQIHFAYEDDPSVMWDAEAREADRFAFAGRILFNDGSIDGFCIEIDRSIADGAVPYQVQAFADQSAGTNERGLLLQTLFSQYYEAVVEIDSNAIAAAFQMMVWEITHEHFTSIDDAQTQISLDIGAVQFADYSSDARSIFLEMQSTLYLAGTADSLSILHNDEYQDFVNTSIPGPAAFGLLALGTFLRRRRS